MSGALRGTRGRAVIFVRVIVAMAAAAGLKLALGSVLAPEALHVEVHAVGAYLAVLGALYGIIVAFLMFKDMDNPFAGVWNVSYAVMISVASRIG